MDIAEVQKLAPTCGCVVINNPDGKLCLAGAQLDALSDYDDVREQARKMLTTLNGLAMLRYADHRPVQLGDLSRVHSDGRRDIWITVPGFKGRARMWADATVVRADGIAEACSTVDKDAERYQRIVGDPKLLGIIEALADELTRQRLRIAFERVTALAAKSAKDHNGLVASKYATWDEVRSLKANIEDPRVAGLDALHAFPSSPQPGGPRMSLQDCRAVIVGIFFAYLDRT